MSDSISITQVSQLSPELGQRKAAPPEVLRHLANEFEASFLAEMLKHTGMGQSVSTFSGGVGEDAFTGMLTREYATEIAKSGRLGIAEQVYQTMIAGQQT